MSEYTRKRLSRALGPSYFLPVIIAGLLIAVGCADIDDVANFQADEPQASSIRMATTSTDSNQPFENDPDLEQLLIDESLRIPDRFEIVARMDREPILSLGLVEKAARLTMVSLITQEILTFDLLQLEQEVDGEEFFAAFADSLSVNTSFRDIRSIGVRRGIGEYARRYVFSVGGDAAESSAFLRHGVVALIGYRGPADLRYPLEIGDLMRRLDESIKTNHLINEGIDLDSSLDN